MRAIYWFKSDLRTGDNRALNFASRHFKEIIPVFIYDEKILSELGALHDDRFLFLEKCVSELKCEIPVQTFFGKTEKIFEVLIDYYRPQAVVTKESISWSGEKRDLAVKELLERRGVKYVPVFDGFLSDPRKIPQKKVFSAFYKSWVLRVDPIEEPFAEPLKVIEDRPDLPFKPAVDEEKIKKNSPFLKMNFKQRLLNFDFKNYEKNRNRLDLDGTSILSPFIRFGRLSVRTLYNLSSGISEPFVKELAWREFWYHIKHYFPNTKNVEFQEKRRGIRWINNEEWIEAFFEGKTGYPIVDAGIRQLKTEKWIPNRMRMILASFFTKDLLCDWRIGERFFAEYLIDYDEVVNTGNWQWVAGIGADPKPFRIFNPELQAKKYDPDCVYMKRYLNEHASVDCRNLQRGFKRRIVEHSEMTKIARSIYLSVWQPR